MQILTQCLHCVGTVLGMQRSQTVNKTNEIPALMELTFKLGRQARKEMDAQIV